MYQDSGLKHTGVYYYIGCAGFEPITLRLVKSAAQEEDAYLQKLISAIFVSVMKEAGSSSIQMVNNIVLGVLCFALLGFATNAASPFNETGSDLAGIRFPNHPQSILDSQGSSCDQFVANIEENPAEKTEEKRSMRVKVLHREQRHERKSKKEALLESCARDRYRAGAFHQRVLQKVSKSGFVSDVAVKASDVARKASNVALNYSASALASNSSTAQGATQVIATLESGVSLGSGEYFMDVFIGTPPKHFSLILDTGSDLNWLQCSPCEDCYEQIGPKYDPSMSSSYSAIPCSSKQCGLVAPPEAEAAGDRCAGNSSSPCRYFYWYGDRSNTTGDLSWETFSVNVTGRRGPLRVPRVVFGCGHANRGLFHGAAGLLGLGRGQLSFTSQLRELYGHKFSYCLVDRDSNASVSSTLVFGEDERLVAHRDLQYTALIQTATSVDTFYYVRIAAVTVGRERVDVPSGALDITAEGYGGTIVDSGTTLTYLVQPAYEKIRSAFEAKITYPRVEFPPLGPCYNVSGVGDVKLPEFSIIFTDGAVWRFPAKNYFIQLDPEEAVVCLAIMGTPPGSLSILGNYQQQNFHILYDVDNSRLGFAPMTCAAI